MKKIFVFLLIAIAQFSFAQEQSPATNDLIRKIIEKAKENEKRTEEFGYYLEHNVKKLNSEKKLKEEETKTYRVIWLEMEPYLELLQVDGKEPTQKEWKKEKERKEKFLKSIREPKKKDDEEEDFSWDDIYEKYDFTPQPADEIAPVVISFHPKKKKAREHNRMDKLLNRVAGRFWADENHNLVRIEAHLIEKVKYGLGLLAKIEELSIQFTQQEHQEAWLPSSLFIRGKGQFALLKNENREIRTRYYNYYDKPAK